jgi:hypothetical protein
VREQQSHAVGAERELLGDAVHVAGHDVVVAVDVTVLLALEAARELGMRFLRGAKLVRSVAGERAGQRFPDVTEQHNLLEVPFQEAEKPQEFCVVVAETVRGPAPAKVQIRDDC